MKQIISKTKSFRSAFASDRSGVSAIGFAMVFPATVTTVLALFHLGVGFFGIQQAQATTELVARIAFTLDDPSADEIKALVEMFEVKESSKVNDQTIIHMAKRQQEFYKDMGIITEKIDQRLKKRELVFRRGLLLPIGLIFFGIIAILCGFYFLVNSIGPGIALWPIGAILVTLGVLRLRNPYLRVTGTHLITYSEFGRKREYLREDVISTKSTKSGVVIQLQNNKKIVINYWDMSRFDREQFERFIAKVHTLDL